MYEVIPYHNKVKWKEKLNQLKKKDIFYDPSYCNLYLGMGDGEPHLFFYENEKENTLCYVFFKRKIGELPFLEDVQMDGELYDIITAPYGYGGPLYDAADETLLKQFREEFLNYCSNENIVCEFIRFHPMLQNNWGMEEHLKVSFDRETVFLDLTRSNEELIKNYSRNHRREIKRASQSGMEFKALEKEEVLEFIDDFYQLYKKTMDKVNASAYSYFSIEYLKQIFTSLSDNAVLGAVFLKDKMTASVLCLYEGETLHGHLAASDVQFLNMGCNSYIYHNMALWGKQKGLKSFHLGGGHVGRDTLFQFKYRFNRSGLLDFYVGKKIHHEEKYNWLIEKWEDYYEQKSHQNFFPAYRAKPQKLPIPVEAN